IFVGGTGRAVAGIVELAFDRLRVGGRLVANVGSVDNVVAVRDTLRRLGQEPIVRMVQLSLGIEQMETMRLESLNPTFLITATKH
ncbi:MAG: hypothetical protein KDA62_22950, partial [Planctomycetales bacterium]|nr:hypothetical protein [Planctomycetales bacterium]